MSDRLFLYITDRTATALHWWWLDAPDRGQKPLSGDWAALATWLAEVKTRRGLALTVLLADSMCSRLIALIPGARREKALQALPFALEDVVIDELDQLYPVLAERPLSPGRWPVLLLDREVRSRVLAELHELELEPEQIVALSDLLPQPQAGEFSVWADPFLGHLVILTGPRESMVMAMNPAMNPGSLPKPNAAEQLAEWLPRLKPAPERVVFHLPLEKPAQWPDAIEFVAEPVPDWAEWQAILAHGLIHNNPLSAVTSASAIQDEKWRRRWWYLAGAALLVVVLTLSMQWLQISQMNREAARLQAQITRDFHAALPQVTRMVNVRVQLQQALAQRAGGGQDGFLAALATFGAVYHMAKQHDDQLAIKSVRYDANQLTVDLTAGQYAILQQLIEQLKKMQGVDVRQIDAGVNAGVAHMRIGIEAH